MVIGQTYHGPRTGDSRKTLYYRSPAYKRNAYVDVSALLSLSLSTIFSLTSHPHLKSCAMLFRSRQVSLTSQRFLKLAPRRPLGTTHPSTRTAARSTYPLPLGAIPSRNGQRVIWAAGGVGVATIVLLLAKPAGDRSPDDVRDSKALSRVPLSKLFSGWM